MASSQQNKEVTAEARASSMNPPLASSGDHQTPVVIPVQNSSKLGEATNEEKDSKLTRLSIVKGPQASNKAPWGVKWRSSSWFITTVVTLGVTTDIITYTIVVPVLPYRLQALNYTNISALTSWLLFAYSIGIFICTMPVAYFFHKYPYRRSPLIVAVLVLEVAVVLFMTIKAYWVMVLSRFIQGAASTVVWSVGFALICENVPEKHVGRQIGFAYSGVSIGMTIAPPIGGALYARMGWKAPFVFCIIVCAIDLILRLFVIEQKDLREWEKNHQDSVENANSAKPREEEKKVREAEVPASRLNDPTDTSSHNPEDISEDRLAVPSEQSSDIVSSEKKEDTVELSPWKVIVTIASSGRGMTGFWVTFIYGLLIGIFEPTLTLRIQTIWDKNADFVGLVYLAAAAPTFVTGPLVGALADKYGAEFIMLPCLIFSLPWIPLLILKRSLPGFIVLFALVEVALQCASGPAGLEVTLVSRKTPGISEIHQFAAMNIAFAISTSVGAVVGGQMYDHLTSGWAAICWFGLGIVAISLPLPFFFSGNRSIYRRMVDRRRPSEDALESQTQNTGTTRSDSPSSPVNI
ncbi:uncharacterized protein IL334_006602 [Kwoniella shivajii]|uniref:Major facilitator superfamily (MFS) profile domain-containing protein n=1 Tax=Kwoniella shivajii TaxID=564305 RepID=A0ABZ1D727_9TREE|nr:hypothetical protein IL334_006602 [Kwoniella shivajii]